MDLDVRGGEIVGFLGPNGAGKTTTLRMLTTLLEPTAGNAPVAGHDLRTDPDGVRRSIGYVAQGGSAGSDARVCEELVFQAQFYGIPDGRANSGGRAAGPSSTWAGWAVGTSRRSPVDSGGGWTSRWAWCTRRRWCSSTSRRLDSTRRAARTCGSTSSAPGARCHGLPDHPLPGRGGLPLRPHPDHRRRPDRGQGHPGRAQAPVSGDLVSLSVPVRAADVNAVRGLPPIRRRPSPRVDGSTVSRGCPTASGRSRTAARAGRCRDRLDGLAIERPTLDDVFLTLTGRTLREEAA